MEEENLENNQPQQSNTEPKQEDPLQFIQDKLIEYNNRIRGLEQNSLKFREYHKATAEEIRMLKDNFKLLLQESQ